MGATATQQQQIEAAAAAYGADPNVLYYIGELESHFANSVNTSDSNYAAGHPSQGWFQFVPSTFRDFAARAKKANPAAWKGVPVDINNFQAQALATSWGITHGHTGDWTTYSRATADAAAHPVLAKAANAGIDATNTAVNGLIGWAKKYLGVPYVWGGTTPKGFDCSGFVQYVFAKVGVTLPRTSQQQYGATTAVAWNQKQPGDLLFSDFNAGGPGHVALYIGHGKEIEAPHTGTDVRIENVHAGEVARAVPGLASSSVVTPSSSAGPSAVTPAAPGATVTPAQAQMLDAASFPLTPGLGLLQLLGGAVGGAAGGAAGDAAGAIGGAITGAVEAATLTWAQYMVLLMSYAALIGSGLVLIDLGIARIAGTKHGPLGAAGETVKQGAKDTGEAVAAAPAAAAVAA
jgi:cell wall-associated NlpC family hydrolase